MNHDIYLRAHALVPEKKSRPRKVSGVPKWPDQVIVFDTETTIDAHQDLTFGAYRRCRLVDEAYVSFEEGLFYPDDLKGSQREILDAFVASHFADIGIKSFPPKLDLKLYPRGAFVEKVFWKAIQDGAMVVGFNLPFDLARLATGWGKARNGGWSLILSMRRSNKTGEMEPNPERPRVRIKSKDSKSAFIGLARPRVPEEWPQGRFLDLHTLALALFGESHSLDGLCQMLTLRGKLDHKPTGQISTAEIEYCRQDVRATTAVLNAIKQEFDTHPIDLRPDRAYSPASIAKAYYDSMGIIPPKEKFGVSDRILGIAMQSYYGGRAECRIRRTPVPVVHTDFTSQYPTVNILLGNSEVLTASSVSFDDATASVQKLVNEITLEKTFDLRQWREFAFFALVYPDNDIFPVRTVYNGQTQNIGVNRLSSRDPIWLAGPDVIASALLAGKPPRILKAICMGSHGKQAGLRPTSLRGMVEIDPGKHDCFRHAVEQRKSKTTNAATARFLKIFANSGSYGLFVEVTPEKLPKPTGICVFSGDQAFEQQTTVVEGQGRWYFPPIASLITAGGRLLLAMLEKCVTDAGGAYLFCDTDSLCIVASECGGPVKCEHSGNAIRALSWSEVKAIADRFKKLNPYDTSVVPDLLKIEDVNFNTAGSQRQLYGYAISAKRYVLYEKRGGELIIVDPKAHGLGYLYPPTKSQKKDKHWTFEAWNWLLCKELGHSCKTPRWFDFPAMMRVVMSTPLLGDRLKSRPFNFLLYPMIDTVAGFPAGADPSRFSLIAPFQTDGTRWMDADYINVHDGTVHHLSLVQSPKFDKVVPQTLGYILRHYLHHPESKSLAPDGTACSAATRGLLQRASVIASGTPILVGKETDRRWEHGEDLSLVGFSPIHYQASATLPADRELQQELAKCGMRELMRKTGLSQHTLEKIRRGGKVRASTLQRIVRSKF